MRQSLPCGIVVVGGDRADAVLAGAHRADDAVADGNLARDDPQCAAGEAGTDARFVGEVGLVQRDAFGVEEMEIEGQVGCHIVRDAEVGSDEALGDAFGGVDAGCAQHDAVVVWHVDSEKEQSTDFTKGV